MVVEAHGCTETPVFTQIGFHAFPCEFVAQVGMQAVKVARIFFGTHTLVAEQVGVEFIRTTAQDEAAGLVVGSDHDERLFGMFFIEGKSLTDSIVHIDDLVDYGSGVVGMAGIVYLASLHHQEEALLAARETVDSGTGDLREREVALPTVYGIGQASAVGIAGLLRLE